ncbi:MAG: hypothetical protein R6T91_10385 [Bacteroidales bacterium]
MNWLEWIGYLASALILVSMLMNSIVKLRIINLAGSILFTAYGFLIEAYPVAFMNFAIVIVNIYYLIRIRMAEDHYFSLFEISPNNAYVKEFLSFYKDDILGFNPDFDYHYLDKAEECWLLMKNMNVAGIFMGHYSGEHTLKIDLDYILKPFRDFRIGHFLYQYNQHYFTDKGIQKLQAEPGSKSHNKYLKKMGFTYQKAHYERLLKKNHQPNTQKNA